MSETDNEALQKSRVKLLSLILIAFVPIFIAYLAYFFVPAWAPDGTTNQGQLITPPLAAAEIDPALLEPGTWLLIQPVASTCDADCEQLLYLTRQVVKGLGKETARIGRAVVSESALEPAFDELLSREHARLVRVQGSLGALRSITSESPVVFLMDPLGNIMMVYTLDKAGKPMQKDIKHLLRVSNIG